MNELPLVEKYRPETLSDLCGNASIIERMKQLTNSGLPLPNLILSGKPGTGKTSTMLCFAKEYLGENWKYACLEINASDKRGENDMSQLVERFSTIKTLLPLSKCKIIILDEADNLVDGAQNLLSLIIDKYKTNTRFLLACNDSENIIPALQSRCQVIRFSLIDPIEISKRLNHVVEKENIKITTEAIDLLARFAEGDVRNALNNLQSASALASENIIDENVIVQIFDRPVTIQIAKLLEACVEKKLQIALSIGSLLYEDGYSISVIIEDLFILFSKTTTCLKQNYLLKIAEYKRRSKHLETPLQLSSLLASLCKIS